MYDIEQRSVFVFEFRAIDLRATKGLTLVLNSMTNVYKNTNIFATIFMTKAVGRSTYYNCLNVDGSFSYLPIKPVLFGEIYRMIMLLLSACHVTVPNY